MKNVRKHNYTLCFCKKNKLFPIYKKTLEEIDKFTSCFSSSDALAETLLENYTSSPENSFVIMSSRNKYYNPIYFDYRPVIFKENEDLIKTYIENLRYEERLSFIENHTKIIEYIESGNDLTNVPIYNLYKSVNKANFKEMLSNYLSTYGARRELSIGVMQENVEARTKFIKTKKINREEVINIIKEIKEEVTLDYNDIVNEVKLEEVENESELLFDEKILNIIKNDLYDVDKKLTEISFLIPEEEKYKDCIEKYHTLIFGD